VFGGGAEDVLPLPRGVLLERGLWVEVGWVFGARWWEAGSTDVGIIGVCSCYIDAMCAELRELRACGSEREHLSSAFRVQSSEVWAYDF
jgi:hypothetical protein